MNNINITTIVENTSSRRGLIGEHGLAFWLTFDSKNILFDTGQGLALENNFKKLKIPLKNVDAIVLSHGHYDHVGGLETVLNEVPNPKIYAHPDVFQQKYACDKNGISRKVGFLKGNLKEKCEGKAEFILSKEPKEIFENLFVTGEIPRLNDFEDTGGSFFLDKECQIPDQLLDDQSLFFKSSQGTLIVLGCAHSGIVNTVEYIRHLTDDAPVYAVMGGMHLVNASQERINRTLEYLRKIQPEHIAPAHCTGIYAASKIWNEFPEQCFSCSVGNSFQIPL